MATERLYQFPSKTTAVPADIIYMGDSTTAFDEVNVTVAGLFGAYPTVLGIGGVTLTDNGYVYTNASGVYTAGTISPFGVNTLAINAANSSVLITSAGGVPSLSQTLPAAVQGNITVLGAQAQALNMNSYQINGLASPSLSTDAANKGYVDSIATGGGAPVVAATVGALTVTQVGAGVGATLTNAGSQAAFSIDGISPTIGQRVLIKNQATNTQNGVYTVTVVGTGATNWVLTRATDYDTPTDINNTGVIPVNSGTVNGGTGWYNTTLMVTVDTTAITFVLGFSSILTAKGTFTPTISPASGAFTTITYSVQAGEYTLFNNVLYFSIDLELSAFTIGTGSGSIMIGTLPYTPGGTPLCQCAVDLQNVTFTGQISGQIIGTSFTLASSQSGSGGTNVACSGLSSSAVIRVSGFYFTS